MSGKIDTSQGNFKRLCVVNRFFTVYVQSVYTLSIIKSSWQMKALLNVPFLLQEI